MAWQFYDFFDHPTIEGPLPEKRWIKHASDKRHKVRHSSKVTRSTGGVSANDLNERHTLEYARWLAQRDGITIPPGSEYIVQRADVNVPGSKPQSRIRAVEFGKRRTTQSGYGRSACTRHHWDVAARIEIPNWDWQPAEPVEEIIPEAVPVPVAPSFKIPARILRTSCLVPVLARVPVAPSCAIRLAA
ncbi:hypothetical protein AB7M45_007829 [Bradyrhizobium elkanii]|uniref:hypothetical protein n=1 Tax=Bradyrhizobium elkanii TaxID=29448 RepID=UPI00091B67FD|nr:hypothetical protein [Bradyrhizobium elkanii]MCW2195056.1 hypothetical protein [Bradyrhizobium elkanii]NWL67251.1 hypothetical protein [Bradyrhizobium elkanii]OIM94084.1 hypothetical protein BLN97_12485 [Bradyrhizobium elkanii]